MAAEVQSPEWEDSLTPELTESPDEPVEGSPRRKGEKKRLKKLQEAFEVLPLSPWERYRALNDLSRHHTDLLEMADRKTRFALVILAALNTVNIVAVARPDILTGVAIQHGAGLAVYVTFYAVLSLYLCTQAIGALKPRLSGAREETTVISSAQKWLDLLSLDVITKLPADDYYELWRTAQWVQLNREIAFKNQSMARIILVKYAALERLYRGLTVLVFLTSLLILVLLYGRSAAS